jgi:hypothetical protein
MTVNHVRIGRQKEVLPLNGEAKEPKFKAVPEPPKETETAPKRRGRPPGSKNGARASRTTSLEKQIGAQLTMLNFVVMLVPPIRQDALDEAEIVALARAIDQQCQASPRFRKYVELALATGGGSQLIMVVGMIGARRLSRHGILPETLDPAIGTMLASQNNVKPSTPFNTEYVPPEPIPEPEPSFPTDA